MEYDWADDARKSYEVGIAALRERLEKSRVIIGDCVLYNADCRFILPTLHNVDLVATDPPYGIGYKTNYRTASATPDILMGDNEEAIDYVPDLVRAVKSGGAIYICSRFDVSAAWLAKLAYAGAKIKTPIVWDKGNHTAGDLRGDYGCRTELILFASKGRHILRNGRDINLWHIPRPAAGEHPTPKPVALMERILINSSDRGDTILDPFMGTSPIGEAAVNLGRKYIGIEINKRYFDLACERIRAAHARSFQLDINEATCSYSQITS